MKSNTPINSNDTDYSIYEISVNPQPNTEETSDGKSKHTWEIQLSKPMNSQINLEKISQLVSHKNYNVSLASADQLTIIANVSFFKDPNPYSHDPSALAHFKLFEDIENLIGEIKIVQGKSFEDWWNPRKYKCIAQK